MRSLTVDEDFTTPTSVAGVAIGKRAGSAMQKDVETFPCVEDNCSYKATSLSNLDEHVSLGLHVTPLSPYDKIALKWVNKIENLSADTKAILQACTTKESTSKAFKGCSLKVTKSRKPHSNKVIEHLKKIFDQGTETGRKREPADVARDMNTMRGTDGNKVFLSSEWLSPLQVASVFSRLAAQSRMGMVSASDDTDEDALLQRHIDQRTTARSVLPQ